MPNAPAFQTIGGQWSGAFDWPIIGIHCILTPDNKILTYGTDQAGQQGAQLVYDVWDIATKTHYTLPNKTPTDMFCSAAAIVPETGQILIMGGDGRQHDAEHINTGVHDVNVYDPVTMTVSPLDADDCPIGTVEDGHICGGHLQYERWYPTAVTLANGKIVVIGGKDSAGNGDATPELYTPWSGWKALTGATSDVIQNDWWYPRAWLASNGRIDIFEASSTAANPGKVMVMDPSGDGSNSVVGTLPFVTSQANPAIMYEQNKVLILADNGDAWIMDMSGDKPTFTQTESLHESRLWSNMVVLADGSVMVSGGSGVYNELTGVTNEVALWNPQTGHWTIGAEAAVPRLYHSTTILLPDATVLSLGGGAPGPLVNINGEIYTPAYLFDGNGNLAQRPVISAAPQELKPSQTFTISVDDASSISRLTFVKDGAVTHSLNMSASKLELSFTVGPNNTLNVQLPENANILTPGNWMLFAFNDKGTPSVASTIRIDVGGELLAKQMGGYVTLNGDASYDAATGIFTLTPDATNERGDVMSNQRLDIRSDFDITFDVYLGNKDAGADGMAFVLHNDPFGGDAIGKGGGGLGAMGIRNGLAIQFDSYQNTAVGDTANDHTNFVKTDAPLAEARLSDQVDLGNIEDGRWHKVHVSWDAAHQTLRYTFDGAPASTLTQDLANTYFAGFDYAYFGFTAGTGGASNLQQVQVSTLNAKLEDGTDIHFQTSGTLLQPDMGGDVTVGGDAHYDAVTKIITLTPDAMNQRGAVMSDQRLDLRSDFDVAFKLYLGSRDAGADGMAFVLHNDPLGSDAIGKGGGGLGTTGIHNGLAIQFDTYQNTAIGDIAGDHTDFINTGVPLPQARLSQQVNLGNIEDGKWHTVDVSWDTAHQTLSYSFDGVHAATLTGDLAKTYFGGSDFVYYGLTAATGGGSNLQQAQIIGLDATLENGSRFQSQANGALQLPGLGGPVTVGGNAHYDPGNDVITLTQDAMNQRGEAISDQRLDVRSNFEITFDVYLGNKDAGADGMAFVLHNDALGANAVGKGGGGLAAMGIRDGLAIVFDTYQNSAIGDIANDHTNFARTDAAPTEARLSDQIDLGNIEDGKWHTIDVLWDAAHQTLSYSVDSVHAATLTSDLVSTYFGGSDFVHFGFTAATGGASNLQEVHVAGLDAVLENGIHTVVGAEFLHA